MPGETSPILAAEGISKSFGGVHALRSVDFDLAPGEIHGLVGENGAGKSTLIKVFSGIHLPDSGRVLLDGHPVRLASPADAIRHRIGTVFQELSLLPDFTVAENIFAGRELRGRWRLLSARRMQAAARAEMKAYGIVGIDPDALVKDLSLSQRQLVEIIKVVARSPQVLILDEATSALPNEEAVQLFGIVRRLRDAGTSIIYISHRLEEIFALADRITVFRDGRHVATSRPDATTVDETINLMIGHPLTQLFPPRRATPSDDEVLSVTGLGRGTVLHDVALHVTRGEVLGVGGLAGQGQTDLLLALCGARPATTGEIRLEGRRVQLHTPRDGPNHGIAYVPEDRKTLGVALPLSVRENIALPTLWDREHRGFVDSRAELAAVRRMVDSLQVRTAGVEQPVGSLSGGNQQKVVLAKWLLAHPRILLMNDPTRGVDVGAKREIFDLMRTLTAAGAGIVFVSSDLTELVGMSDRVAVMYEGTIVRTLDREEISPDRIVAAAMGVTTAADRTGTAAAREAEPSTGPRAALPGSKTPARRLLRGAAGGSVPTYVMLALLLAYYLVIDPTLLSTFQLASLLNLATPLIIATFAQTMAILTGGIDLSVGSVIGLSNVIAATTFSSHATAGNTALAIGLPLLAGLGAGALNGAAAAWGRLPAIIVTLATLSIWLGVGLRILPAPGGTVPSELTAALTGTSGPIPNALFLLVPLVLAMWLFTTRTSVGRAVFAVGDDEGAAYANGLAVGRAKFIAYATAGFLAAIAGLFITALTSTGDPLVNQSYTLNSVAGVVIGGTSLMGGVGSIWGSMAGAGILAVVVALLPFANISSFWQTIFSGVILIAALGVRSALSLFAEAR